MRSRKANSRSGLLLAACVLTALATGPVGAQTRKDATFTPVGYIRSPGSQSSINSFQNLSYGLGSLRSAGGGTGGDALNSSLSSLGTFLISRADAGVGISPFEDLPDITRTGSTVRYDPSGTRIVDVGGQFSSGLLGGGARSPISPATAYLEAIGAATGLTADRTQPILTLAPKDANSKYGSCMQKGERYFKDADYERAYNEFQLAGYNKDRDPSSLLSMAHATFAMSRGSYVSASYYVRQALKYFPELPVVPLQPKAFFGQPAEYVNKLTVLEQHVRERPNDAEARFLLGYFRWFEGDSPAAQEAFTQAFALARRDLRNDVKSFWNGMVATGKASGTLGVVFPVYFVVDFTPWSTRVMTQFVEVPRSMLPGLSTTQPAWLSGPTF